MQEEYEVMPANASLTSAQRHRPFLRVLLSTKQKSRKTGRKSVDRRNQTENGSRSISEVGLPVLGLVCDPKLGKIQRGIWGTIWLVSLIFCIVQCTNCFHHFADMPTVVNIRYHKNMTIDTPYVTICPTNQKFTNPAISPLLLRDQFGNVSYTEAHDLLLKTNMSIRQMWSISGFSYSNLTYGLSLVDNLTNGVMTLPNKVIKTDLLTIHGTCLMFKIKSPIRCMGIMTGLYVVANGDVPHPDKNFMGLVHTTAEIPLIRYFGTVIAGYYGTYQQFTTIYLRVQEMIRINTRRHPCQPEEEYVNCLVRCVERNIMATSTSAICRLPFMETMSSEIASCTTAADFLAMYTATDRSVRSISESTCGCSKPCREFQYWEDNFLRDEAKDTLISFMVIRPHCYVEVIEEMLSYGFTNLFSDVGGSLGLFLGVSLLSIFELLDVIREKLVVLKRAVVN